MKYLYSLLAWTVSLLICPVMMLRADDQAEARDENPCFARFVPERLDDFAWENDRIAFRMYGPKMWTIPSKRCGSGIDVWVKKVRYPIINKWYKRTKYHEDKGEGADFYTVGKTLGCGGLGYWTDDKLLVGDHFSSHKVIQGAGRKIEFELGYAPKNIGTATIAETKHISMEAGSSLFKVESTFSIKGAESATVAIGIVLREGQDDFQHGSNWLSYAEHLPGENGTVLCGAILPMNGVYRKSEGHGLMLVPVKNGETITYYAGAAWDKGLDFKSHDEWIRYLKQEASRLLVASKVVTAEGHPASRQPVVSGLGVIPLEIYRSTKDERYLKLGMKRADEQWKDPTPDGFALCLVSRGGMVRRRDDRTPEGFVIR